MSACVHAAIFDFARSAQWTCIGGYVFVTPKGVLVELKSSVDNRWHISLIVTPRESRKNGFASEALQKLLKAADENNAVVSLIPSPTKGSSVKQRDLIKWYQRNGFIKEAQSSAMIRHPRH